MIIWFEDLLIRLICFHRQVKTVKHIEHWMHNWAVSLLFFNAFFFLSFSLPIRVTDRWRSYEVKRVQIRKGPTFILWRTKACIPFHFGTFWLYFSNFACLCSRSLSLVKSVCVVFAVLHLVLLLSVWFGLFYILL